MAQCRRFSPEIVNSDAFLEMAPSTQALYFQLGMRADDDGFVNPRGVMKMVGSSEDELKVLVAKRFVLPFESGVIVIKHWRINNRIRPDWHKPTLYTQERNTLYIKENKAYTLDSSAGTPLGTESVPTRTRSLVQNSIDRDTANAVFVSEEGEPTRSRGEKKAGNAKYEDLCKWAEGRAGRKFVHRVKQYAALKRAKGAEISITRLKERWTEMEGDTWRDGLDWGTVVSSFDKKA